MRDIRNVWPYSVLEDTVWFSNYFAGGLYTYNYKNGEVCCKIKPDVIFSYGIFEIAALACWKSFIFLFSGKLDGLHIVYDRSKKEVKKIKGLKDEQYDVVHQAIVIGDALYLVPWEIKKYIYVVKLSALYETADSINLIARKIELGITMRTWLPKKYDQSLYIPEYGGKRVFSITNSEIKVVDLDIPSGVYTIEVFQNELWVALIHSKHIFCLTLEGKFKERVEVVCGRESGEKNDIWEIIAKDEFVFFVHCWDTKIDIYIRKSKKIITINGKDECMGNEQHYLPYIMDDSVVHFLPSGCRMLEIDLPSLTYRQKEFGFPTQILDAEWDKWCRIVHRQRCFHGKFLNEKNKEELRIFKEYISDGIFLQKYINVGKCRIGRVIYQYISEPIDSMKK